MKTITKISAITACFALGLILTGCDSVKSASGILNQALEPLADTSVNTKAAADTQIYQNKSRNFSFSIPGDWSQQSGDVNSSSALFMAKPVSRTCSFQFNINPMPPKFPSGASISSSLTQAKKDLKSKKLIAAKRRDQHTTIPDKNGKQQKIRLAQGWEVVEAGLAGGHQRIIYQTYDRNNYYMNFLAAAQTEQFEACRPALRMIIDSIKFAQ